MNNMKYTYPLFLRTEFGDYIFHLGLQSRVGGKIDVQHEIKWRLHLFYSYIPEIIYGIRWFLK